MIGPSSEEVSTKLSALSSNNFVVNIGCHDGKSWDDPCYPLFKNGLPGLAIDGVQHPHIHDNLPFPGVKKIFSFVTPMTTPNILRQNGCPDNPHMIKVDVDGYDMDILAGILVAGIRPDFFQIEIQPEFPPPVIFSVKYHPVFISNIGFGGFYGVSISAVEVFARSFGYTPVFLDNVTRGTHDILCVKNEFVERGEFTPLDTKKAYAQEGCRNFHFEQCGIGSRKWHNRTDWTVLLAEMFQACVFVSQARFGVVLPFELGLDWASLNASRAS